MGKYFGTDGFRGEANQNLTFDHAVQIGIAEDGILAGGTAVGGIRRDVFAVFGIDKVLGIRGVPAICLSTPSAQASWPAGRTPISCT